MPRNTIASEHLTHAILKHPDTDARFYVREGRKTTIVARELGQEPVKYRARTIKGLVNTNHPLLADTVYTVY